MARMFVGTMVGDLNYYGVASLKAALSELAKRPDVDGSRIGAVGFCLGGSVVLTWACTDRRLKAIAPYYGLALRTCATVEGSGTPPWPGRRLVAREGFHDRCRGDHRGRAVRDGYAP